MKSSLSKLKRIALHKSSDKDKPDPHPSFKLIDELAQAHLVIFFSQLNYFFANVISMMQLYTLLLKMDRFRLRLHL